jgi:hypothetical protein
VSGSTAGSVCAMKAPAPLCGSRSEPDGVAVLAVEHTLAGVRAACVEQPAQVAHDARLALVEVHALAHQRRAPTPRAPVPVGAQQPDATTQQSALELLDVPDHGFMFAARMPPPAGGMRGGADDCRRRGAAAWRSVDADGLGCLDGGYPVDGRRRQAGRSPAPRHPGGRYDRHRASTGRALRARPT